VQQIGDALAVLEDAIGLGIKRGGIELDGVHWKNPQALKRGDSAGAAAGVGAGLAGGVTSEGGCLFVCMGVCDLAAAGLTFGAGAAWRSPAGAFMVALHRM
jgi:hypothetical protein